MAFLILSAFIPVNIIFSIIGFSFILIVRILLSKVKEMSSKKLVS